MRIKRVQGRAGGLLSLLAVVLLLSGLAATGCTEGARKGVPALPTGFQEAGIPDIDLNGYVFVTQESPLSIPLRALGTARELPPGAPEVAGIHRLLAWLGPTVDDFGGLIEFTEEDAAAFADLRLAETPRSDTSLWYQRSGSTVRLVRSTGQWAEEARQALREQRTVPLAVRYPNAWETLRLLPEDPPARPVAAGFIRHAPELVQFLMDREGIQARGISSAMGFVRIGTIAFAVYSDQPLELPPEVTEGYLKSLDVGAVVAARAGYPGFVVSFLFGSFAGRAGLDKVEVAGETVRYRTIDELHLFVKSFGTAVYFTVSPNREQAESLMAGVLAMQK